VGSTYIYNTNSLSTTSTFYLSVLDQVTGCESERTPVAATINELPNPPVANSVYRCGPGTVTLSASGGMDGEYRWYMSGIVDYQPTGVVNSQFTTPFPIYYTTYFYVSIQNDLCESERVPVLAIIVNPTQESPTANNEERCGSGPVTFTASGATGNQEYRWYNDFESSSSLASTPTLTTPSLSVSSTFYVSVFDTDSGCESPKAAVTATVNPIPAPPVAIDVSRCGPGSVTFSGTSELVVWPFLWYDTSTGATPLASTYIYTTNSLSTTSTFYLSAIDPGSYCESTRTPVTAIINDLPAAPLANSVSRCGPGTVTLSASGGIDGEYRWYNSLGMAGVNSSYTTNLLYNSSTFYVSIHNGLCESEGTEVQVTINPLPESLTADNEERCGPGHVTFTASGATGSQEYRWYNDYTGGTSLASTPTFTTPSLSVSSIFYVSILVPGGESCRKSVEATIHTIPEPPLVIDPYAVCPGANVTVKASHGEQTGQYRWYENGSLLSSRNSSSYSISNITETRMLDVAFRTECESAKTNVTVNVVDCTLPAPSYPTVIASTGENFTKAQGSLAWTLGEVVTETYSTGTRIALTQGFHQPLAYVITELGAEELPDAVYPNPVRDVLKIRIMVAGSYQLDIINTQGQTVYQVDKTSQADEVHEIPFMEQAAALYILRLTNTATKQTELFKIIKQ